LASVVGIWNRALQKLGAERVASITENSVNARACQAAYEAVRDALLEDYEWSCATTRVQLAASTDEPEFGKARSFPLPSDFIRLAHPYPEDNTNDRDWVVEGQSIYTNESAPLDVRYIYRLTNANEMTSLFRETLSTFLAFELCEELTQSNTKKDILEKDCEKMIRRARSSNAIQKIAATMPEDPWLTARN
jgi:hypothetical protein